MFHGTMTSIVLEQQWQWPYILGSFAVAWLGSITALHIMKQRTSDQGLTNFLYLLAGSVAFGAVAVWSMHFIGMQALSLIDPTTGNTVDIRYDPLFTAFSLVVVVVIVAVGFHVAGDPLNQQWWRYVFGGCAGAGGVLAMHYLGMLAMTMQAEIDFDWRWVLGSVLIGVAVVSVGLLVFFRFRQLWQHNHAVMLACSLVLAVAVMGVHYSGLASAAYYKTVETPDISHYSPLSRLLYINIALAAACCGGALIYLTIKYIRMLQLERRKFKCLVLNALILDTPHPNSPTHTTTQPTRVLCTTADTLPSVVIEESYEGAGTFNGDNADFLRMYKTSTDWVGHNTYAQFLAKLKAQGHLSAYSLGLHTKFINAAMELCSQCGLQLSELDLLYWQPTQAVVTVVVRVSQAVGERVEKTTNCRFTTQESLYPAVACMTEGADGKQWMDELITFHERSTLPPPPIPAAAQGKLLSRLSHGTQPNSPNGIRSPVSGGSKSTNTQPLYSTISARTKRFFHNSVSPMASPRLAEPAGLPTVGSTSKQLSPAGSGSVMGASTDAPKYKLYLGLHYVKVEAHGLQVLIPSDGPYHHVPATVMLESSSPFTMLGADHINFLRELRSKEAEFELGAQCMIQPLTARDKKLKVAQSAAADSVTAGPLTARPRFANGRSMSNMMEEDDEEVDDDTDTNQTLKQIKKSSVTTGGAASPKTPTNAQQQRQPPTPLTVDLEAFTDAFHTACYSLAEVLGTSADLLPGNLIQLQLLPYGPRDWLLAFSVVCMSSRSREYNQSHVRWLSLKAFEILHYARHSRIEGKGWTRRWVREQSKRRASVWHEAEYSDSGNKSKREKGEGRTVSVARDGGDSINRRTTMQGEPEKNSDSLVLKTHHRGPSASSQHHRDDSLSRSQQLTLPTGALHSSRVGSLPNSVPGSARAAAVLGAANDGNALMV